MIILATGDIEDLLAREEEKIKIAQNLLGLLEDEVIAEKTGLSIEVIRELNK